MARKAIKKPGTGQKFSNEKFQSHVEQFSQFLMTNPMLDGVWIQNVQLDTGSVNEIAHKLNRKPLGWILLRPKAQAVVWEQDAPSEMLGSKFLYLQTSANVTADLWVF